MLVGVVAKSWASPKILPLFNGNLSAAGSTYEGDSSGFKGAAQVEFVPVIELNGQHAILPFLKGSYRGTQSAIRILDGGNLFQSEQNFQPQLGWIYRFRPDWKLVTNVGEDWTFLKESTDEKWGDGLYDHQDFHADVSVERRFRRGRHPGFLRGGMEFVRSQYPNYESLDANEATSLQGQRPLDADSYQLFLKGENSLSSWLYIQYKVLGIFDDYHDQRVVETANAYSTNTRRDRTFVTEGRGQFRLPSWDSTHRSLETVFGFNGAFRARDSNQNEYDINQNVFIKDYYDFQEGVLGPSVEWRLEPLGVVFVASMDWTVRRYNDRPTQNSIGVYESTKFLTVNRVSFFQLSVPVGKNLRATASFQRAVSRSNTDYNAFYNYDYATTNAMAGLSYAY